MGHLLLLALGVLVSVHRLVHELMQRVIGLKVVRVHGYDPLMAVLHHRAYQRGYPLLLAAPNPLRNTPGNVLLPHHSGPDSVVYVMVYVRYPVRHAHYPSLGGIGLLALCVADYAVSHLPGEVQPLPLLLEPVHHPKALPVVLEAPAGDLAQGPLPGVAEGGVPQVVGKGYGLGQVLVEPQGPGDGPRYLGDL